MMMICKTGINSQKGKSSITSLWQLATIQSAPLTFHTLSTATFPSPFSPVNRRSFPHNLSCDWPVSSPHFNSSEPTQHPFFHFLYYGSTSESQYLPSCVEAPLGSARLCQITRSVHTLLTAIPISDCIGRVNSSTLSILGSSRTMVSQCV